MYQTLSQQMNDFMKNGFDVILEHQDTILAKWNDRLIQMQQRKSNSAPLLESVVDFFSQWLFSENESIEDFFIELKENWKNIDHSPSSELIFFITLLENAVHETIQSNGNDSYWKHQSVQYLFSKISEELFGESTRENLDMNTFLEQLVHSRQIKIDWVATLVKSDGGFRVMKVYSKKDLPPDFAEKEITANSLFALSELLLDLIPSESGKTFPIPWEEKILLFCTEETESQILPFITYTLQMFQTGERALKSTKEEQLWKDSVILFNEWIMRSKTLNEALENITSGFVNYLPFKRCGLFSYSNTEQIGFGLYGHHLNTELIQKINEDINNLPIIKKSLQKLQLLGERIKKVHPIYMAEASGGLPIQYVQQFELKSIVIAPIYVPSESKLIGAAFLDQGPGQQFEVSRDTYTTLMKFGQSAGEILAKFGAVNRKNTSNGLTHLSSREIEVLKLVAEGASTIEAADQLHLSEYTVRDYISTIMQKMNAKNRTEAIVKAIRSGII
ncbi:DNA-binding response regulator [Pueribacillus theae]|uniref:DNA-binding response regulator n=1 Tax=Pueribacillus theae TaxID=2171751 RepID=A0A2U1K6K8_9BACI|nr:response regulator transcription factor [Pueribacillus theae]PWA13032.1 DNA-binding response regulator [Pueribacillus theae]